MLKGVGKVAKIVGGKQIPEVFKFLIAAASKAESAFYGFISLLEHFLGIDLHIPNMDEFEKFGNFINDTLDAAKRKFTDGKTAVSEFYGSLADGKVKAFVDKQTDAFQNFFRNLTVEDLKREFQNATSSARSFFEQFDIHIPSLSDFRDLIGHIAVGVWNLGEKFQNAGIKISEFFSSLFTSLGSRKFGFVKKFSDETGEMADNAGENIGRTKTAFDYLISAIDFTFDVAGHIISRFVDIFKPVWDLLLQGFSDVIKDTKNLTFLDIMKIATLFMAQDMQSAITRVMDSLGGFGETLTGIGKSVGGFVEGAKGVFEGLGNALSDFQESVNAQALINIAIAVAILAGSVIALSMIDVDAGLSALFSISMLVGEMLGAMTVLSKVTVATGKLRIDTLPIIKITAAVVILAGALVKLAALDVEKLRNGLLGVTALVAELTGVALLLGRYGAAFGKGMTSLLIMAFAVSKLAKVIIALGDVKLDALLQGGAAVGAIMAAIIALSYALWAAPVNKLMALGNGVVLLAFGIKILAGAVQALGSLDNETLLKGGAGLGVMATGIIAFSYALWAAPVGKLVVVGLGLSVIAAGMTALSAAAFLFSRFSWSSLAKAGAALGGILALSALASHLINPLTLIAIAGALTVLGVALFALAIDFQILASLGWSGFLISIASLASVLFLVGVAGALLGPMVPVILSLSGAIILFGLGIGLLGAGAIALSAGLAALGPGIVIAAASVGGALGVFIAAVIEGAAEILHALALMGNALAEAFRAIGLALIEAIVSLAIPLSQGIMVLIIALLDILTEYMDPLIDKIIDFIDKFLDRLLDEVLPALGDWVWKIVVKVADILLLAIEGLVGLIPGIGQAWREGVADVRKTVNDYWDDALDARRINRSNERKMRMIEEGLVDAAGNVNIAEAGGAGAQAYVDDFLGTLRNGKQDISREAGNISGIMETVRRNTDDTSGRSGSFDDVTDRATRSVGKYSGALDILSDSIKNATGESSELTESFQNMSESLFSGQSGSFDGGEAFVNGYVDGISSQDGIAKTRIFDFGKASVDALAESIDAHSPSRKTESLAEMWGAGFIGRIETLAKPAYLASYKVGEESVNGLTNPFSTLHSGFDDLYSFSPTITPILDLSAVDDGMLYLQNEFAGAPAFGVRQTWTPDICNAEALLSLERPGTDVNRIIDEMGYLRDDVVRMGQEISRMKVYLDTGALVGEMSGPMDLALGQSQRRSVRSGRR